MMVDGDDISMAFSKRSTKGTPELVIRLQHGYTSVMDPTIPFIPQVLSTMNLFMRQSISPKAP